MAGGHRECRGISYRVLEGKKRQASPAEGTREMSYWYYCSCQALNSDGLEHAWSGYF